MSQRMTFLYSPWLSNQSSRPVTKPTALISKAWWPGGMPNLDRTIAPLRMRVDTVSYPRACIVRPPKWPYIRRHIGLSQSEFGNWSTLTHESFTTLDLAETSALDCAWHVVPFIDESDLYQLFIYQSYWTQVKMVSPGQLTLSIAAVTLPPATEAGRITLS